MIISMIPNAENVFKNHQITNFTFLSAYKPYINYSWSQTLTVGGNQQIKDTGTARLNLKQFFGQGCWFNGVDQTITVPINTTIQTVLKRVNGVVTINETSQTLTNYVISGLGVHKDYYLFTRLLTTAEKDSYTNTPEAFYAMAQADNTCVLNMPMCETDSYASNMKSYSKGGELDTSFVPNTYTPSAVTARIAQFNLGLVVEANKTYLVKIEYDDTANSILTGYNSYCTKGDGTPTTFHTALKGIVKGTKGTAFYLLQIPSTYIRLSSATAYAWITTTAAAKTAYISVRSLKEVTGVYPITNYTSSVRDNAKNLQYGLQTCKFVRDSLGVIQSASDYLECDGVGYAIIPSHTDKVNIKTTVNPTSLSGNLLSGGVTKTLTGLTLNVDNDVVISNVTPTGAITLASGFSGTIKTYTEELV